MLSRALRVARVPRSLSALSRSARFPAAAAVRAPVNRPAAVAIHTHESKRAAAPSNASKASATAASAASCSANKDADIFTRSLACGETWVNRLQSASSAELFHYTSQGLVVLAPVAWLLSPSALNFPVDLALGVVLPVHAHLGWQAIAVDYVPKNFRKMATGGIFLLTALTIFGLLKVNLCGPGITESVKSLWKRPRTAEDLKADKKELAAEKAKH